MEFWFSHKKFKCTFEVNIITQVFLIVSIAFAMNLLGILLAILVFIVAEPIIFYS